MVVDAPPQIVDALALAVIESSEAPLVLLDSDLMVVAASVSFCRSFEIIAPNVAGKSLFALGAGEWDVPQLRSLLKATLSGSVKIDAYEMDLKRPGHTTRRLVLKANILDYGHGDVRLMLAVTDVTEARLAHKLKDELLSEKAVLLQELQHRVANSLQIIASVLMQTARKVSSEESRAHLYDAHSRVMSIATLQQQLAVSKLGDVALRTYFKELCDSIGASMIRDHNQLTLEVHTDDSIATADASVSLGLIVTELVINALKHAFPGGRRGKISVGYLSRDLDWTLSVEDDGVGIASDPASAKAGLGTSIVEALARQLRAVVNVANTDPGTKVSVTHIEPGAGEPKEVVEKPI